LELLIEGYSGLWPSQGGGSALEQRQGFCGHVAVEQSGGSTPVQPVAGKVGDQVVKRQTDGVAPLFKVCPVLAEGP
ncbi:hypothetical protein, partial [Mycobacterium tuberculosis]|uniref:hypothetical protein n=1 Tax=Mycobacterium tuberculosis TaxID=1773 RepID=UPI00254BB741